MGHDCETASSIGMWDAADIDLIIAADDRRWVFVTHDKELARRMERDPIGRVIHLRCAEPDAPEVFETHLEDFEGVLGRRENVLLTVWSKGFTVAYGWRGWIPGDGH